MQIQINTDNHISTGPELTDLVESTVAAALERFGTRVTRVEVHLSDENSSAKGHSEDKRCAMEARLAGMQPVAVSDLGPTLDQAISGAADKLLRTLDRAIGRREDPKGRTSMAGEQSF